MFRFLRRVSYIRIVLLIDLGDKRVLSQPSRNSKIISRCIKVLYAVKNIEIEKDSITRRKPLRSLV